MERRRTVCYNLRTKLPNRALRLVTLTVRSAEKPLRQQIRILETSFAKLRRLAFWYRRVEGGIYFLEVKRNPTTGLWHPHVHAIVAGDFIPWKELRAKWLKITGDSFIVDVRLLRTPNDAAGYVAKYATKSVSPDVWCDTAAFAEAIAALRGVKTFRTFGTWNKLKLLEHPEQNDDWHTVGTLAQILRRARTGDTAAVAIIRSLRSEDHGTTLDLQPAYRPDG